MYGGDTSMTPGRVAALVAAIAIVLFVVVGFGKIVQNVDADQIVVIQDWYDGELHWYTAPGIKKQMWGRVTVYPKRDIYSFSGETLEIDGKTHSGAKTRFNDGAEAIISGSLQFDYPLDDVNLTELHTKYGNREAVKRQLIEVVTDKAIFMTGPLLSSKESYSERRTDLINWSEDQVLFGIYRTRQVEVDELDAMTGEKRTVTRADILLDADGNPQRQERAQLTIFGIQPRNFAVTDIVYTDVVRKQIDSQQENIMAVQTSIAEAKQAEQRTITVEQQGKANAATAKWEQEVIKAREITAAEQRREVARLDKEAANFTKEKEILLGEGEAERKRLVLAADGALAQKLATFEAVQKVWADAYSKRSVPSTVFGSGGVGSTDAQTTEFQQTLQLLLAGQMGLDLSVPKGSTRGRGE